MRNREACNCTSTPRSEGIAGTLINKVVARTPMILRIKLETVSDDMTAASLLRINAFSP
jgi:hypothetical protein